MLLLVLLIGAALRFYQYSTIPFTHDEFSALFRTGYGSFSELIEKGVLVDFHPAGVQVFMHYYGSLFGFNEWVLKLPFTLMGLASVYLIYLLGKEWFNSRTGLLAAAFIACTQYFVFYSQIARPYPAGLFFGLLALLYWRRFLFDGDKVSAKNFLLWVLFIAICAYIHYYLLLSLVLISILGLLISPRSRRPLYILSGFFIVLLYLPHLKIFILQLEKGGVGTWLGKPDSGFLTDYFSYVLEHSLSFMIVMALLILVGLLLNPKASKFWWVSVFFFGLSFSAGYLYSVFVNPILQFSGLIFSFPIILVALMSFVSYRKWLFHIGFWSILVFSSYGLIMERQHYKVFYQSPYEYLVKDVKSSLESNETETLVILDNRSDILRYYLNKYGLDESDVLLTDNTVDITLFSSLLKSSKADRLLLGSFASSAPEMINIAQHYFPIIVQKNSYFHGEFYELSKKENGEQKANSVLWEDVMPFPQGDESNWKQADDDWFIMDSINGMYLQVDNENRFNPGFSIESPGKYINSTNAIFDVEIEIENNAKLDQLHLAISLQQESKIIRWQSVPLSKFQINPSMGSHVVFHSMMLNEKYLKKDNLMLKAFILNDKGIPYKLYGARARFRAGNPKLYSLFTKVGH